ncbi:unnamed protein product [Caenorhabditis angaria]|uniref:Arrestin C-terminal-like domain-containing protein n=1 Tax=Caenorhabditis angaria TaxID=860376 RepID=A0A9P1MY00_9PELO|nr:unnamed protein product [Caenorhabditis angaria]
MVNSFQIEFINSPHGVYFQGQTIDGRVIFDTKQIDKIRSLQIYIRGFAKTRWSISTKNHKYNEPNSHTISSKIEYLEASDNEAIFWNCVDDSDELPRGTMIFPFKFQLPLNLPPSFEGFHGHIRYSIHVELDRVVPISDLNRIPTAIKPIEKTISRNFGFGETWQENGPIFLTVIVPKTGFVAGQLIPIQISIENNTQRKNLKIRAKLLQIATFKADDFDNITRIKHSDRKIAQARKQLYFKWPVLRDRIYLRIPACVPSFTNCPILSVEYFLCIKIDLKKGSLKCEFPIIIGTLPLGLTENRVLWHIHPKPGLFGAFAPTYPRVYSFLSMNCTFETTTLRFYT